MTRELAAGKKTYALAIGAVVVAVVLALTGEMTWSEAANWAWQGGVAAALRLGIAKLE